MKKVQVGHTTDYRRQKGIDIRFQKIQLITQKKKKGSRLASRCI
jgi:hypothetical protein